jgi:uncharacterized protein (TIGR03032 family)
MNLQQTPALKLLYSPEIAELLYKLHCSIVISTYKAAKLIFIGSDGKKLIQIPKHLKRPMGIHLKKEKLVVATFNEVLVFVNSPRLAKNYPNNPEKYDALFMPRAVYYTGEVDLHDILWGGDEIYAINTLFSCIVKIDENYGFTPFWKPDFITDLFPDDRCHLNGMCLENENPAYVSMLGACNEKEGWRKSIASGGLIMDVRNNEILLDNLPMPHSPRIINNELYILLSATGQLMKYNFQSKEKIFLQLPGFARGMAEHGDYLFIGLSKIRERTAFKSLPISEKSTHAGIEIVHKPSLSVMGQIIYEDTVEEIYDVQVLPDMMKPCLVAPHDGIHEMAICAPDLYFWKTKKVKK